MSLLLNMLSRLVITFLPRNKRLSISWLQSPSAVILEPRKIKSAAVSTVSPSFRGSKWKCGVFNRVLPLFQPQPRRFSEGLPHFSVAQAVTLCSGVNALSCYFWISKCLGRKYVARYQIHLCECSVWNLNYLSTYGLGRSQMLLIG